MLNRSDEQSSLSRLRGVLEDVYAERVPSAMGRNGWEVDLCEVTRRLERLRSEFPALADQVELSDNLLKARERLGNGER